MKGQGCAKLTGNLGFKSFLSRKAAGLLNPFEAKNTLIEQPQENSGRTSKPVTREFWVS